MDLARGRRKEVLLTLLTQVITPVPVGHLPQHIAHPSPGQRMHSSSSGQLSDLMLKCTLPHAGSPATPRLSLPVHVFVVV